MNKISQLANENNTQIKGLPFSRRTMLRGIGVSMALPFMESVSAWAVDDMLPRDASPPIRTAVLFSGNGFHNQEWWAKRSGDQLELGRVLSPLND